jgi:hypothetical protein
VDALQQPARLIECRQALDLRIEPRMQFRIGAQGPAKAEDRAVAPALRAPALLLGIRHERRAAPAPFAVRLPMAVRVIADQRLRQNAANVVERFAGAHPLRDRLTPAHEVIELVAAAAVEDDVAQLHVAEKIRRRLFVIVDADFDVNRVPQRPFAGRLRSPRKLPVRRRKNAPDHVPRFVVS